METILQGVLEVAGVSAALVFNGSGQLLAHRAHAMYDQALCSEVSGTLAKAVDSIQLHQEDWETVTSQFADGKVILRSLAPAGAARAHVLAVVSDASLNMSFATIAIRVAANKLRRFIEEGGSASRVAGSTVAAASAAAMPGRSAASQALPPGASQVPMVSSSNLVAEEGKAVLAHSGLSWSKASTVGLSGVNVADAAASAFLTRCAKELARHVGPISKLYVQEGVRRVSPSAPFATAMGPQLVEDLAGNIEDEKDRAQFKKALAS